MKTKFNEYLTKLRKSRVYTQAQMAEKLGISRSTYTNYENGNRTPDFEVLERISEVLACSLDELFGRKPTYVASCDVVKEDSILYNVSGIQEEKPKLAIGVQDFRDLREKQAYYVDKTQFIEQFLESWYQITLITRPRRFGKTLNMSMLAEFLDCTKDSSDLFCGTKITKSVHYKELNRYPVVFLSFLNVKAGDAESLCYALKDTVRAEYERFYQMVNDGRLSEFQVKEFNMIYNSLCQESIGKEIENHVIRSIAVLCQALSTYYGEKVFLLLDEYDTPMQEAYIHGYWDEFIGFMRGLFNAAFKTNPYLERAVMTGITRVSKESVFSDLNNLAVITTTSEQYADCFGFTEEEVFSALDAFGMSEKKQIVKQWYDGFIFGQRRDIYNPWSITNYLKEKKLKPYWAATSSNALISKLIQTASADMKKQMERLLNGELITVSFDEQVVFSQLEQDESAIWSLLVASGYLKVEDVEYRGMTLEPWYHLDITNLETVSMFSNMFKGWFAPVASNYNEFIRALLEGNVKAMNLYMNDVALATFSSFDVGKYVSERTQPERFYHGFVLGLLIEIRDRYDVRSNRESGFGRYDVMLLPKSKRDNAIILEFKVREPDSEKTLEDTVESALDQIIEKKYDAELLGLGITQERIRHYGFAFEGKKVLIG